MEATKNLSVLVISPHPSALGGVVAFIETMKKNLTHCQPTSFYVGSKTEEKEALAAKILRTLAMACNFIILLGKNRFDVVHINPSFTTDSLLRDGLILLVLRLAGYKKTLVYFHGWNQTVVSRVQRTFLFRILFRWLMSAARFVLVLSPAFKPSLTQMGLKEDRIIYARTMFDGSEFNESGEDTESAASRPRPLVAEGVRFIAEARRPEREQFNKTILYMSRFDKRKGIYELLEAFERIAGTFPEVTLTFAGDGVENKHLREKANASTHSERILFTGYVTGVEKIKRLQGCTIFVLASTINEGMPVALLEAMAAGKPLLVSKVGGIPFIIREPQNGVVLKTVSTDTIATALHQMLSDESYCASVGMHNKEYAWKNFEAKAVTAEIEKLYDIIAHS